MAETGCTHDSFRCNLGYLRARKNLPFAFAYCLPHLFTTGYALLKLLSGFVDTLYKTKTGHFYFADNQTFEFSPLTQEVDMN